MAYAYGLQHLDFRFYFFNIYILGYIIYIYNFKFIFNSTNITYQI